MKKIAQLLLISLFGLINYANAQVALTSDSLSLQTDTWIDSVKVEYAKYKEHLISADSIKPNWQNVTIGINGQCDTLFFFDNYYNLQNFNQKFKDFLLNKSATDTTVLQLGFGDNQNVGFLFRSFEILAGAIDNNTGHGIYYFKIYNSSGEREKCVKTDTIDLLAGKVIRYNGRFVKNADLRDLLKRNKPEIVLLRVDNELPVQNLVDVLQIGNELKVKMILGKK